MENPNRPSSGLLFREEVLDKKHSHMGQVLIHQSSSYAWIALASLALVCLVIAFLFFGTYTQKVTAPGLLVPNQGVLRVLSPASGQVTKINVSEGEFVKQGEPLFVVSEDRISQAGELKDLLADKLNLRANLILRDQQQNESRLASQQALLKQRISATERKRTHIEAEIVTLHKRIQLSSENYKRLQTLNKQGHVADFELQNAQAEQLALVSQKQALIRVKSDLESDLLLLKAEQQNQHELYQRQKIELEQKLTLVHQEIAENNLRSNQIVQAPFSGKLTGLSVQAGQQITLNSLMVSLIPEDSKLQASLYLSPSQIGFVEKGQDVLLRYAAYPCQKYGMQHGRVVSVTSSPYSIQELPTHIGSLLQNSASIQFEEQNYYKVLVYLQSQNININGFFRFILPGMRVESAIKQDTRRIYEWVLEPLYSMVRK